MIYAVIPIETESEESLNESLLSLESPAYKEYAPRVFLVDFKGNSRELCEKLGIGEDPNFIEAIVLPFSGYYGFASSDLWQWVKANG